MLDYRAAADIQSSLHLAQTNRARALAINSEFSDRSNATGHLLGSRQGSGRVCRPDIQ